MKLGIWNRFAIAVSGLALLVGPPAFMFDAAQGVHTAHETRYKLCLSFADGLDRPVEQYDTRDKCNDDYISASPADGIWTLETWLEALGGIAALCALSYMILFALSWVARWVWRGRSPN